MSSYSLRNSRLSPNRARQSTSTPTDIARALTAFSDLANENSAQELPLNAVPHHRPSAQLNRDEVVVAIQALALGQRAQWGCAGIVSDTGQAVARFRTTDRVAVSPASCDAPWRDSTTSELIVSERDCVAIAPAVSFAQAAVIASSYQTAWHLLVSAARLKPGEIILIVDLSHAVSSAALQLAVQLGAFVIAVSEDAKHRAAATAIGAQEALCQNADLATEVRRVTNKHGADVAVNGLGGESWSRTLACLARGGRMVTAGTSGEPRVQTDLRRIFWNHLQIVGASHGKVEDLEQVFRFFETARAQPVIDSVFPWDQEKAARQRFQSGAAFGSVVLSK